MGSVVAAVAGILLTAGLGGCPGAGAPGGGSGPATGGVPAAEPRAALAGTWRAVLHSPGGELPFTLRVNPPGADVPAVVVNGPEELPFDTVARRGSATVFRFEVYDSEIVAVPSPDRRRLVGYWTMTVREGMAWLPFSARRGDRRRFVPEPGAGPADPEAAAAVPSVAGSWAVVITEEDGSTTPARAEFEQEGDRVVGTFLTPTGDYRYLEGEYRDGLLRLSCFDGGHAYLLRAQAGPDGTLLGDFWSRDASHATWRAERLDPGAADPLPDGFALVGLRNDRGRFRFRFPDLEGRALSSADPRFRGKVVLVNLFGSWCPNCNDEAPLLVRWYRRYRDRGLEVVGLAFEVTGDPERDRQYVRRYAERHGIEFPLLLAGTSDKADAARRLPDLTGVLAFPTNIFVGRDGRVRRIHTGFAGPATGEHHRRLVAEFEALIEELLAEPVPP